MLMGYAMTIPSCRCSTVMTESAIPISASSIWESVSVSLGVVLCLMTAAAVQAHVFRRIVAVV
jgi:hypothetical protein